ncbi:MAG: outer membrane protein assembly factor, partial [Bdellovibrionaceae bacterium]|nr:outer membrane protein assembly factor [Pseudobdellovibrionaceae bacterium]
MKMNSFLRSIALVAFLLGPIAGWEISNAQAKRTLNIGVLPQEQQSDLLKRYPQILNGKLSLEVVDDIIRYLQARPEFDLVQVVDTGNDQLKLVTEKSTRISAVKMDGIRALSDSETKSLFGINSNDVLNQDALIAGGERLRQQYNQIGYRNASIDMEIPPDGKGNVEVHVKVKEGVQTLIGTIQFYSPNQDLNKSIGKRLSRQSDNALTDAELADVQKKTRDYLSDQGYIRAEITGPEISFNTDESRAQLVFKIDKVDAYSVEFSGNREVSSSTLSNSLELQSFYSASPNIGAELAAKIKSLYLARGYARAEVQSEESEGRKPYTRRIVLNIDEGPKIRIAKFEFSGNISRESRHYAVLLKKQSSDLIQRDYYNKDELDQAFKAMVIELQNEGYLLAKINSTRTQYNKEKTQVSVFVNMDEGSLTQIEDIQFTGNTALTAEELLRVTELNKNEALKLANLEKAIANLRLYYQEKGYIEMAILND